jgi:hypothetical protein
MKNDGFSMELDFDFNLFAIITSAKEYKLAWWLNKILCLDLQKDEDIILDFLKGKSLNVSNYSYKTTHSSVHVIRNKCSEYINFAKPYLIPELQQYDYLLLVKDPAEVYELNKWEEKLNSINIIELVQQIEINSLQSKENLIFE